MHEVLGKLTKLKYASPTPTKTMNCFFALAIMLYLSATPVDGKKALLARIENPELHNGTMTCNVREMELVSETIGDVLKRRRRLEGGDDAHRHLLVPRKCSGGCQAAPSYCQFMGMGCVVQNRRRLEDSHSFLRKLSDPNKAPKMEGDEKQCLKQIEQINEKLGKVAPTLSSPCQEMVTKQKHFSCVDVVPCTISHFSLWNTETNAVIVPVVPAKGTTFCQNTKFTFEAIVNFDNGPLQFSIMEKKVYIFNSTVTYSEPYYMTSGSPTDSTLQGLTLEPGTYDLTAWPENDTTKLSLAEFKVKKC
jgi:hypothetical protein